MTSADGFYSIKLLMFCAPESWFKPFQSVLSEAGELPEEHTVSDAAVIFFHAGAGDAGQELGMIIVWIKNVKSNLIGESDGTSAHCPRQVTRLHEDHPLHQQVACAIPTNPVHPFSCHPDCIA